MVNKKPKALSAWQRRKQQQRGEFKGIFSETFDVKPVVKKETGVTCKQLMYLSEGIKNEKHS